MNKPITTRKEIANAYAITPNTLRKRLKELDIPEKKSLTPKEVRRIFEELGEPA